MSDMAWQDALLETAAQDLEALKAEHPRTDGTRELHAAIDVAIRAIEYVDNTLRQLEVPA